MWHVTSIHAEISATETRSADNISGGLEGQAERPSTTTT